MRCTQEHRFRIAQANLLPMLCTFLNAAKPHRIQTAFAEVVTGTRVCLCRYLSIHEPKSEYCDAPTRQATNGYACAQA